MQAIVRNEPAPNLETFDARGLPAPDNILAILKKAGDLANGAVLEIRLDSNPFQLYDLLQQRGCFLAMTRESDGTYRGHIRARDTATHN